MRRVYGLLGVGIVVLYASGWAPPNLPSWVHPPVVTVAAQAESTQSPQGLDELRSRVARLESRSEKSTGGAIAFLFGAFCALWAQNTKRNAWGWFFAGAFFNVIAVLVLLAKTSDDIKAAGGAPPASSRAVVLAVVLGVLIVTAFAVLYLGAR